MTGDIQTHFFEGIYEVEEYMQIFSGALFIFIAILSLPINFSSLSLDGTIPNRFWFFTAMPIFVYFASGILRWVEQVGNVIGSTIIEKIEHSLTNQNNSESSGSDDRDNALNNTTDTKEKNKSELN